MTFTIEVVVGLYDKNTEYKGQPVRHEVREIINHSQCGKDKLRLSCDLALIRLSSDVDLSNRYVNTLQLPKKVGSSGISYHQLL